MFNPLAPFLPQYLGRFRQKGNIAFVKQTYERGNNPLDKDAGPAWVLSHFDDLGHAINHYDKIKYDPGRRLYDLKKEEDLSELRTMLNTASNESFYTTLMTADAQQRAKKLLDKQIRTYIEKIAKWNLNRNSNVKFTIYILLGEIWAQLENGSSHIRIKLSELEKISAL